LESRGGEVEYVRKTGVEQQVGKKKACSHLLKKILGGIFREQKRTERGRKVRENPTWAQIPIRWGGRTER